MAGPVSIEEMDTVLRNLKVKGDDVVRAASRGLRRGAMDIIRDAVANLRRNGSWVTGLLAQSGKVQAIDELTIDAGFFDPRNRQSGYAYFVEYGRRAGKMPPPDELAQWAYKKYKLHDRKLARQAGWALAMRIMKNGTRPHPFFAPAIEKNKSTIIATIKSAINDATR